ncbi:MAG: hypothetical protein WA417_13210 [Stellaceae bacterium]
MHPIVTTMRALDSRGPKSRRMVVDAEGAMLGPDCVLVRRTPLGYRCTGRAEAAIIQCILRHAPEDPDWLFRQCCRIAKALADGHMALAQIHALFIPTNGLDDGQLTQLALVAPLIKTNFNPDEPRDTQGRWSEPGSTGSVMPPLLVPAGAPGRTTPWSIPETPTRAQSK